MSNSQSDEGSDGKATEVVGEFAKIADAKVITLLLGRSAKAAGDYFGEKIEGYFKRKKEEARQKNVGDHITRVVEVVGEPGDVKPAQYFKIERWIRIAADVSAEDVERSAVFEAALAEIISSEGTSEYEEVAEKLTSDTARVLLNAPSDGIAPRSSDQRGFEGLKTLGLAETLSLRQVLALVVTWATGTVVGLVALFNVVLHYFRTLVAVEFVVEAVVVSFVLMVLALVAISTNYRLTEFGATLQRSARRFYQKHKLLGGASILSAVPKRPWVWGLSAALLVCVLPPLLELYLPAILRTTGRPTVVITSPPVSPPNSPTNPAASAPAPDRVPNQVTLSSNEVSALVEFWTSIKEQMNIITEQVAQGQSLVETWPQEIEKNRDGFASRLIGTRNLFNSRRASLSALMNIYGKYPNVEIIRREVAGEGVFTNLYLAFDSFANETQSVPLPPKDFEERLNAYANGVKVALIAMSKWAKDKAEFAALQSRELSKVEVK